MEARKKTESQQIRKITKKWKKENGKCQPFQPTRVW